MLGEASSLRTSHGLKSCLYRYRAIAYEPNDKYDPGAFLPERYLDATQTSPTHRRGHSDSGAGMSLTQVMS